MPSGNVKVTSPGNLQGCELFDTFIRSDPFEYIVKILLFEVFEKRKKSSFEISLFEWKLGYFVKNDESTARKPKYGVRNDESSIFHSNFFSKKSFEYKTNLFFPFST